MKASQRDRRGMTPHWPRMAFENHSIQCDSRSSGLGAALRCQLLGVAELRRGLRETPRIRPALSEDRRHGQSSFRRRIMELVIGVMVWLVLAGCLLALFSDNGRGE